MRRRVEEIPTSGARSTVRESPFQALIRVITAHDADVAREEREARQHRKGKRR
jgi:hypothetical protein